MIDYLSNGGIQRGLLLYDKLSSHSTLGMREDHNPMVAIFFPYTNEVGGGGVAHLSSPCVGTYNPF